MIKVMIGIMKEKYFVCGGAKNGFYEKGERVALYQKDQKVIGNRPKNATVSNESVLVSDAPFSTGIFSKSVGSGAHCASIRPLRLKATLLSSTWP